MSNNINQLNFSVRTPIPPYTPNRGNYLHSGVAQMNDLGDVSTNISSSDLLGHTLVVHPSTSSQVFTLPTASDLLSEFGKSLDTGLSKTAEGNMLVFNVVNRGNFSATILSNPTGGDGTRVSCGTGAVGTGNAGQLGKITPVYLEWLSVSSGLNGSTGHYTIYN